MNKLINHYYGVWDILLSGVLKNENLFKSVGTLNYTTIEPYISVLYIGPIIIGNRYKI